MVLAALGVARAANKNAAIVALAVAANKTRHSWPGWRSRRKARRSWPGGRSWPRTRHSRPGGRLRPQTWHSRPWVWHAWPVKRGSRGLFIAAWPNAQHKMKQGCNQGATALYYDISNDETTPLQRRATTGPRSGPRREEGIATHLLRVGSAAGQVPQMHGRTLWRGSCF